jgi:hypothetical protein
VRRGCWFPPAVGAPAGDDAVGESPAAAVRLSFTSTRRCSSLVISFVIQTS